MQASMQVTGGRSGGFRARNGRKAVDSVFSYPSSSRVSSAECSKARHSIKQILFGLFATLALSTTAQEHPPGAIAFPGSPWAHCPGETRYEILYREIHPSSRGNHELLLRDRETGKDQSVLAFDRHTAVLWAPGCRAFAVTDWTGSDSSRVLLYAVSARLPVADIQELIFKQFGRLPGFFGNHHMYLEAVAWPTSDVVRIRASGYGDLDPRGFEAFYEYKLGGSIREVPAPK